jgi:hypothetical protein
MSDAGNEKLDSVTETTPAPLSDYETRRVESGDVSDALYTYQHRVGCTSTVARRVVFAKWREFKDLPEPTVKFFGNYDTAELPIKPGMTVTIKKGTMVKTVGREPKPAGRTYKVKVNHILSGVTRHRNHREDEVDFQNPKVVWAGPGGYWSEVDINDIPEAVL